ncbi:MAG: O-antigen ligase family protein, partial [Phycisphaerales bacterium JB038]
LFRSLDPKLELSLLFRWQYLIGALRIFVHEPLLGVGPDDFKAAYLLFKPAFSPEEITSPHSVLFDYLATLGLGGAALGALFLWFAQRGGSLLAATTGAMKTNHSSAEAMNEAPRRHFLSFTPAVVAIFLAIIALRFEAATLAMPDLLARLAGAVLFALLAQTAWLALRRQPERSLWERATLLGGASVLIAHTQIEMTATQPGSATLAFLILGLAAGAGFPPREEPLEASAESSPDRLTRQLGGGFVLGLALVLLLFGYRPVLARQTHLRQAAEALQPAATIRWDLADLERASMTEQRQMLQTMEQVLRQRGVATLGALQPEFVPFLRTTGLASLEVVLIPQAIAGLEQCEGIRPRSPEPRLEMTRLHLSLSFAFEQLGQEEDATSALGEALEQARELSRRYPEEAAHHRLAQSICDRLFERTGERALVAEAFTHAERALQLDPRNITLHLEVADFAWGHERPAWARELYTRVLTLNGQHRLDPLKQLAEAKLQRARERSQVRPD